MRIKAIGCEPLQLRRVHLENSRSIDVYRRNGGYEAIKKVLDSMSRDDVINEMKKSALRGRGGAGFPTGLKWSFVPKDSPKERYVVCNADESEPGTFKDRYLMERDPHMLIEGMLIAAYSLGARTNYIYTRGEYKYLIDIMDVALAEARAAGLLGEKILGTNFACDIYTHTGAGAYICGEETALLSSLEGMRGHPRMKPPFPAISGLYACPTVVNNVETLTAVPDIIKMGGEAYQKLGTEKSGGTKLWSVSGHINNPGVYELPMGYDDMEKFIMEDCGGIRDGKQLKAVIPGGSSVYIMRADQIIGKDVRMDYEGIVAAGSMVGSGGFIVMDETVDVFESTKNLIEFYKHESCGWCTPCREGTDWLVKVFKRIADGDGRPEDAQLMLDLCDNIEGKSFCPLGDAAAWPIQSAIKRFPEDFRKHLVGVRTEIERYIMTEEEYFRMKNLLNTVIEQQAVFAENQRKGEERQRRNDEGIAALLTIAEMHEQEINKMNERMDVRFADIAKRFQEIGEKTAETDDRIKALVNVVERYISKN